MADGARGARVSCTRAPQGHGAETLEASDHDRRQETTGECARKPEGDAAREALGYVRTRRGWKRRGFLRGLIRRALRWLLS